MNKIPAIVVTGFLGSGKTTLIRHLVENAKGRRLALIINEFGDLGIDGDLLRPFADPACTEDDIIELTNGCICCRVADDFVPTLEKLLSRAEPPSHIVIETSGLALPQPLVKAFRWSSVAERATVGAVVAVIDGPAVRDGRFDEASDEVAQVAGVEAAGRGALSEHDDPVEELFEDQLRSADLVVINKRDLLGTEELEAVRETVRARMRPGTRVMTTMAGRVLPDLLLDLAHATENAIDARPSHHELEGAEHDHDDFESFIVETDEIADRFAFENRLGAALRDSGALRCKGFAAIAHKDKRLLLQYVSGRLDSSYERDWAPAEPRATRLVVIGEKGFSREIVERVVAPAAPDLVPAETGEGIVDLTGSPGG